MKISDRGLELIKEFEGFSANAYLCPAGKPTIGYGSTFYTDGKTKVTWKDKPISEEEATRLLGSVIFSDFYIYVYVDMDIQLTQNQFDALTSFAYNIGMGNFAKSTLLKRVNAKDFIGAGNEFLKWNKSGGKPLLGLTRRRQREKELFLRA